VVVVMECREKQFTEAKLTLVKAVKFAKIFINLIDLRICSAGA